MNAPPASPLLPAQMGFADRFWTSSDGLRLHYRDYGVPSDRPALLCLPGLTRNARDFSHLAERLAGHWRVVCPDLRGRGDSAYAKNAASYNPQQYAEDLMRLLAEAQVERFVAIGTSLGGILTLLLTAAMPQRIAGALLNDVGPEITPEGLERIRSYVGQGRSFPTWMHAARQVEELQGGAFPDYQVSDWLSMAKRAMVLGENGRIVFDYDMKIAEPLAVQGGETAPDLWPALLALKGKPVALLRGELSDILSPAVHRKMAKQLPGADLVTVARVGHAPMLDEAEAIAVLDRLLAKIE